MQRGDILACVFLTGKDLGTWAAPSKIERDVSDGETFTVYARTIVNAAGPFYSSMTLYVWAFLLAIVSWLKWPQELGRASPSLDPAAGRSVLLVLLDRVDLLRPSAAVVARRRGPRASRRRRRRV